MHKDFDVVVFGATGFTGKEVARYIACQTQDFPNQSRVAIAGRSKEKLEAINADLASKFPVLIADVKDTSSLSVMAQRTQVVINCVGPYRFFGDAVVKACVDHGASYVDVSGEPEFLELMQLRYDRAAKEKGVVVVGSCGFDSIPADLGVLFTARQFPSRRVCSIESFLSLHSGKDGFCGHYATFESAVHGFANAGNLKEIRAQLFPSRLSHLGPTLKKRGMAKNPSLGGYILPFMGADAAVVKRTQYAISNDSEPELNAVQYNAYFTVSTTFWWLVFLVVGGVFSFLAGRSWGRTLLLRYPRFFTLGRFSHEGPTAKQLRETSFTMRFIARGYSQPPSTSSSSSPPHPDLMITTLVSGMEPGYVATPIFVAQAAYCVLNERKHIPVGVLTPGYAFRATSLIDRLQKNQILFSVLEQKNI